MRARPRVRDLPLSHVAVDIADRDLETVGLGAPGPAHDPDPVRALRGHAHGARARQRHAVKMLCESRGIFEAEKSVVKEETRVAEVVGRESADATIATVRAFPATSSANRLRRIHPTGALRRWVSPALDRTVERKPLTNPPGCRRRSWSRCGPLCVSSCSLPRRGRSHSSQLYHATRNRARSRRVDQ